ncbi:hypothetical protein SAICODRAFT_6971 [Saitoella complicata NRRL Y-17804]|uniref:uncharacterized protein n=1 Tax=Saitoella complicata (strain BCRC 22490 / CBS 7301 / JCM 7358 / NBRC 10748 / NRRL Y-17804) TaxID=698492 RepID=UPI000867AC78|nr:uncharacterized protein SAICODRAFT_6971 [Saitoella complicata NRRL Y-17804]ODQ53724.1 hypothetical protein SAICODRAFT_6971 [Saitoella complicata NRRL Y-17804]
MPGANTSWPGRLHDHPVFAGVEPLPGSEKTEVIALRGTEVFVAVGDKVRWADLRPVKLKENSALDYKTLDTPEIHFGIRQLAISPNGRQLAVIGEEQVAAITVLPAEYLKQGAACKTRIVGRMHHNSNSGATVVKTLWHPLSRSGQTLLVLGSDTFLRMYDLSLSCEEPEQTLRFMAPQPKRRGFVLEEEEVEAASMCFGDANGWGLTTVYALMKNGDVYAASPVVPKHSVCERKWLDQLVVSVQASHDDSEDGKLRTRWVNDVVGQAKADDMGLGSPSLVNGGLDTTLVGFRKPNGTYKVPAIQGPFLFQPAPLYFSDDEIYATDITYVSSGFIGVLVIASSDGKLDVCLDVEPVEAMWANAGQNCPVVSVYESINLGLEKYANKFAPVLLKDEHAPGIFYIKHCAGVHQINVSTWLAALQQEDVEDVVREGESSEVSILLNTDAAKTGEATPAVGLAVLFDSYLGYGTIAVLSTGQVVVNELEFTNLGHESDDEEPMTPEAVDMEDPIMNGPRYMSLLSRPAYTKPAALSAPKAVSQLVVPVSMKGPLVPNETSLRFLATVIQKMREDIRRVFDAGRLMQSRLESQQKEYSRQLAKLNDLARKLKEGCGSEVISERLQGALDRQKDLEKRADALLQNLIATHSPALSDVEKKWFVELKRMNNKVEGMKGYTGRLEAAKERWNEVQESLRLKKEQVRIIGGSEDGGVGTPIKQGEARELKAMLDEEEEMIAKTKSKLERLLEKSLKA